MLLGNLFEDINDRKFRFRDSNNNVIVFWNNPRPKFLIVLGSFVEDGEQLYSVYSKTNNGYKINSVSGETLINYDRFHFYEDELDFMTNDLENNEVVGDILSNNLVEGAVELEEFKMEYYLA